MAKITRAVMKIFGSSAGANQRAKIGSLAAGASVFTTDIATMQSLSNYLDGWFSVVDGSYNPAIEDMNSLCYLFAYQIAYIMQAGIPEWDATTTYYIGSLVNSSGKVYVSLTNDNLNNAVTDTVNWQPKGIVTTTYTANGSFTAPEGVTQVRVSTKRGNGALSVVEGSSSTYLIDTFRNLWTCGDNLKGELGVGDVTPRSSPSLVLGGVQFRKVSLPEFESNGVWMLGLNGRPYFMGLDQGGNSGVGTADAAYSSPVLMAGQYTFVDILGGPYSFMGLTPAGDLYSCGEQTKGQLGIGDVTSRSSPNLVIGGFKWQKIFKNSENNRPELFQSYYGLTTGGTLYSWGANASGQLGVGDVVARSSPVLVLGSILFKTLVATTTGSIIGLNTAGAVYGMGANSNGQFGGDTNPRSSPVITPGGFTFEKLVSSSTGVVLALTSAGTAYGWGNNLNGELGIGAVGAKSSPILVLGGLSFQKVATTTGNSSYGLTTNNLLYAWGLNAFGQLGVGDVIPRSSPVLVLGGFTWRDFMIVGGSIIGVTMSGECYSWGRNTNGQLGNGGVAARSSPVLLAPSVFMDITPVVYSNTLTVVPGTVYTITISQFQALFGQNPVGTGPVESLTVEYSN